MGLFGEKFGYHAEEVNLYLLTIYVIQTDPAGHDRGLSDQVSHFFSKISAAFHFRIAYLSERTTSPLLPT